MNIREDREALISALANVDEDGRATLPHLRFANALDDAMRAAKALRKNDNTLYRAIQRSNKCESFHATRLGRAIIQVSQPWIREAISQYRFYKLSPYIQELLRALDDFPFNILNNYTKEEITDDLPPFEVPGGLISKIASELNLRIDQLRIVLRSKSFASELNSHCRAGNKNHKGLTELIDNLFGRYSKVVSIRLDLGYGQLYSSGHGAITRSEAQADRKTFIQSMRKNKLFKNLIGYAWKLEWRPLKGWHYHFAVFANGSKIKNDITYAMLIGEHWKKVITSGRGIYFNSNANPKRRFFPIRGTGMFSYQDGTGREGLKQVLSYLTKPDSYLRLESVGHDRNFGRSQIKRHSTQKKGRPRNITNYL